MGKSYGKYAEMFKALSDENRLMILDMLCKGEMCACKILEKFNITQPTLSHHMKILCDCGLVKNRKVGKWIYYSINGKGCEKVKLLMIDFAAVCENKCTDEKCKKGNKKNELCKC